MKKKIKTGSIEISADEFNPKKGKFRVNMFVDLDVIDAIRKLAAHERMPYQTWINRKLRELVESPRESSGMLTKDEVTRIVDERLRSHSLVEQSLLEQLYSVVLRSTSANSTQDKESQVRATSDTSNLYEFRVAATGGKRR